MTSLRLIIEAIAKLRSGHIALFLSLRLLHGDFSSPDTLDQGRFPSSPAFSLDASGKGIMVWNGFDSLGRITVYGAAYELERWSPVSTLSPSGAIQPVVSVYNGGNKGVAAWIADGKIQASTFDGVSWQSIITINCQETPRDLSISLNDVGDGFLVWGGDSSIQAAAIGGGGVSTNILFVTDSNSGKSDSQPQLFVDSQGRAVAIWLSCDVSMGIKELFSSTYSKATASWSIPSVVSTPGETVRNFSLSHHESGEAFVVWETILHQIKGSIYSKGGWWSNPDLLSPLKTVAMAPKGAINARGEKAVLWQRSDQTIEATLNINSAWTEPKEISLSGAPSKFPSIFLNDNSEIGALWQGNGRPYVSFFKRLGLWTHPVPLSPLSLSTPPIGAMDQDGVMTVAWTTSISPQLLQVASGEISGLPIMASSEPIVAAHLAAGASARDQISSPQGFEGKMIRNASILKDEYIHVLSWKKNKDPKIHEYRLYQNGRLLKTLSKDGPFCLTLRGQKRQAKYALVAVGVSNETSQAATIQIK